MTRGIADGLSLAAAPTFAAMALLTGAFTDAVPDILCSVRAGGAPFGGMAAMYALMCAFTPPPG